MEQYACVDDISQYQGNAFCYGIVAAPCINTGRF